MNRIQQWLPWAALACAWAAAGCNDDSASISARDAFPTDKGVSGPADSGTSPDIPIVPDALPDIFVAPQPDALPDVSPPDAAWDAEPDAAPLPPDAGPICDPETPDDCGELQECVGGHCRTNLSGNAYRMTSAILTEPAAAAPLLQGALGSAIQGRQLNLLVVPEGYLADSGDAAAPEGQYRIYVGTGLENKDERERPDGTWAFRHTLPIQHVDGHWTPEAGATLFRQDEQGVFGINIPGESVLTPPDENGDQERVTCYGRIEPLATIEVRPMLNERTGQHQIEGRALGHLPADVVNEVEFTFNGNIIRLAEFFVDAELNADADGDGVNDAYIFDITMTADPVVFRDRPPPYDPDPAPHPACGGG